MNGPQQGAFLAGDKTVFSTTNKNTIEKQEQAWINGTKKSAKSKTVLPPVEQGVQWLIDHYFMREKGKLPFIFNTRQSLIKNTMGKKTLSKKKQDIICIISLH